MIFHTYSEHMVYGCQPMFCLSMYMYTYIHTLTPTHTHTHTTHPYTHTHTHTHTPHTHTLTPTLNPKGHSSCTLLGGRGRRVVAGQQMELVPTTVGLHGNQGRGGVRGEHT